MSIPTYFVLPARTIYNVIETNSMKGRNNEYRISNKELRMMKGRIRGPLACRTDSSILFFPSKFIIPCSIFDIVVPWFMNNSQIISGLKIAGSAGGDSLGLRAGPPCVGHAEPAGRAGSPAGAEAESASTSELSTSWSRTSSPSSDSASSSSVTDASAIPTPGMGHPATVGLRALPGPMFWTAASDTSPGTHRPSASRRSITRTASKSS